MTLVLELSRCYRREGASTRLSHGLLFLREQGFRVPLHPRRAMQGVTAQPLVFAYVKRTAFLGKLIGIDLGSNLRKVFESLGYGLIRFLGLQKRNGLAQTTLLNQLRQSPALRGVFFLVRIRLARGNTDAAERRLSARLIQSVETQRAPPVKVILTRPRPTVALPPTCRLIGFEQK